MATSDHSRSRVHDLLGSILGLFALGMLITSPWQVDTSGPDPFYKGPLIFPLATFALMVCGSLPSLWRMLRPEKGTSWHLDGKGFQVRTLWIAVLLMGYMAGLVLFGLEISTWLFLVISLRIVGHGSPLKMLLIPLGTALVLHLLFKVLLDIWFPQPLFLEFFLD